MIERARFQNYRCLKGVDFTLGPLTVLVGPNGSGKSSALRGLLPGNLRPDDAWQHDDTLKVRVQLLSGDSIVRDKHLRGGQASSTGSGYAAQMLHLDLNAVRSPNPTEVAPTLESNGSNLTNAFATLSRVDQGELASQFSRLIPTLQDVNARPLGSGRQHLLFQDRWSSQTWYTAAQVSDGTMLVLAYLVLQYQRPQVDLLLVEEPERGLHPYLLGSLVGFLRRMAHGEIGPRSVQIVLATHSADLLDHLEPSEVRFLTRDSQEGTVRVDPVPVDTPEWQEIYRSYDGSLGSIWKSGGLRGVPGT
jgi:predicted ATPase